MTIKWSVPLLAACFWGIGSTQLFLEGWLATANLYIAIVGFATGRMSAARAFAVALAAVLAGALCSVFLSGGFWLLLEVMRLGRTPPEKIVYWVFVALSATFMLPRLPAKLQRSWRAAMSPESTDVQ